MRIVNDFGLVRIVSMGDPFTQAHDVRVEWQKDGAWTLYRGFNSLSDDYVWDNSREAAGRAIRELAAEAAV
jgi:hypothetical protein